MKSVPAASEQQPKASADTPNSSLDIAAVCGLIMQPHSTKASPSLKARPCELASAPVVMHGGQGAVLGAEWPAVPCVGGEVGFGY